MKLEEIEIRLREKTPMFTTQTCLDQDWLINRVKTLTAALELFEEHMKEHEYSEALNKGRKALEDGE